MLSMKTLCQSMNELDQGFKKIAWKPFYGAKSTSISTSTSMLVNEFDEAEELYSKEIPKKFESDYLDSESSGNSSELDEVNKVQKIRTTLTREEYEV